jgi:hypothetical protein
MADEAQISFGSWARRGWLPASGRWSCAVASAWPTRSAGPALWEPRLTPALWQKLS